ncbi:MAG: gliding motility-associated C-terminal domain-containing protein [Flavobacteriaceae bacterium]
MKKTNSYNSILVIVFTIMLLGAHTLTAQVLNQPLAADNPNLTGNSAWTAACASTSFNEYYVEFTWSVPLVDPSNEFVLELSDSSGNFGSPRELNRISNDNVDFDVLFRFQLPSDIRGDNYKFRVRSTSPAKTSPASQAYPMHYIDYNLPLLISEDGSGTIPSGGQIQACDGNSIILMPHNIPNANTYQYNWYRSGTLLAEKSESLTVSTPGMYYVELDYGSVCSGSANTLSNTIEITTGSGLGIAISGADDIGLCSPDPYTLQANLNGMGLTYTWYKDGSIVSGPALEGHTYNIDTNIDGFSGVYEVEAEGTGTCLERSSTVTVRNLGNFLVTRENDENIVLLPSQTKTISVSSTAISPSYQWYKDGNPITDATDTTINIDETGVYFARVTENGGSCSGVPVESGTTTVVSPDSFEFVVAYADSYSSCQNTEVTLSLSAINAVGNGARTDVTSDLQSAFSYQWVHEGNPLSGETSKTILISDFENNGGYSLQGSLDSFSASSNDLPVTLAVNGALEITTNGTVLCEGGDPIIFNTSESLADATFEWYKDGVVIDTATENITAAEIGVYQLVITTHDCPWISNEISIRAFDESLLVLDGSENITIVEGETETLTASGASSYQWFDTNNTLLGTQDAYSFDVEGEFLLVADFGNCSLNRIITVTYRDTFAIPNVITINGDGINDLWVLPNTYSRDESVLVTIYNERGKEVFSQTNYENNWPESTTAFNNQNMIFYYTVSKEGESLKQGTITVIR